MYSPRQFVPFNQKAFDHWSSPKATVARMRDRLMLPGFASIIFDWLAL